MLLRWKALPSNRTWRSAIFFFFTPLTHWGLIADSRDRCSTQYDFVNFVNFVCASLTPTSLFLSKHLWFDRILICGGHEVDSSLGSFGNQILYADGKTILQQVMFVVGDRHTPNVWSHVRTYMAHPVWFNWCIPMNVELPFIAHVVVAVFHSLNFISLTAWTANKAGFDKAIVEYDDNSTNFKHYDNKFTGNYGCC